MIATYEKIEQVRYALAQSKNASHIVTTTPKQEKPTRIPQPPQTNQSPTMDANNMRYAFFKIHLKNSLQFQLDDIPFPTNADTMPVYERLLNFGLSLYVLI